MFLSFQDWNGIHPIRFAGIDNFVFLIQDPLFLKSIGNTVILMFTCGVPQQLLALFFAFILNPIWGEFGKAVAVSYLSFINNMIFKEREK
jgi:ABC-type sugar transport system permease subunit